MSKCQGITEPCWVSLTEDQRIKWKYFSRLVALIGALFVTKTGNAYFDWLLMAITSIFFIAVIESQRSYSRLTTQAQHQICHRSWLLGSCCVWHSTICTCRLGLGCSGFFARCVAAIARIHSSRPACNHFVLLFNCSVQRTPHNLPPFAG
jgi:hypothetical protein